MSGGNQNGFSKDIRIQTSDILQAMQGSYRERTRIQLLLRQMPKKNQRLKSTYSFFSW